MRVRVPLLLVSGFYEYEVDAKKIDEAVEKLKNGEAQYVRQEVLKAKLNYDAAKEVE